ncbi:MAG TPA: Xaa-Pro peptidase family protein [Candidatus Binatia bacterium]|nr:Xaa-Pro peptidase family protein [Candidatus Binatia bacterium]
MSNDQTQIERRLALLREQLERWDVDGLLIGSPANRRWLSGFTGSAGWLLVTHEKALLATDFRYWSRAEVEAPAFTLYKLAQATKIGNFVVEAALDSLGLEAQHLTLSQFNVLRAAFAAADENGSEVTWCPLETTVEPWRAVKTPAELTRIRAAAAITDSVMAQVNDLVRPGQSERELAWELEKRLREAGAEGLAFPLIVASGPYTAFPHYLTGDRILQQGDTIVVDMGAAIGGYNSDLTRSFYLGQNPSPQFWEMYELALQAQMNVFAGARPGMTGQAVDALARDVIAGAGHAEHFGHGTGHGVGLEIHEAPRLSPLNAEAEISAGMVITVEPGVYIPGQGGVRIEDLALVIDNGLKSLSHCPKTPLIAVT